MKLGSVYRVHQMQSDVQTMRSLANFHTELEQFCCSLTAIFGKTPERNESSEREG